MKSFILVFLLAILVVPLLPALIYLVYISDFSKTQQHGVVALLLVLYALIFWKAFPHIDKETRVTIVEGAKVFSKTVLMMVSIGIASGVAMFIWDFIGRSVEAVLLIFIVLLVGGMVVYRYFSKK